MAFCIRCNCRSQKIKDWNVKGCCHGSDGLRLTTILTAGSRPCLQIQVLLKPQLPTLLSACAWQQRAYGAQGYTTSTLFVWRCNDFVQTRIQIYLSSHDTCVSCRPCEFALCLHPHPCQQHWGPRTEAVSWDARHMHSQQLSLKMGTQIKILISVLSGIYMPLDICGLIYQYHVGK